MIKAIEFPNRTFATKQDLFNELKKHESKIISLKKANVYKSSEKGQFTFLNADKLDAVDKAYFNAKEGFIYPIISTTRYMDHHKDVHFDGSMTKTAKEQQGKVLYALDHKLEYDSVIAWEKSIRMFVASIPWGVVGKNYAGNTEGLVFEISKEAIKRKDVLQDIENKSSDFENSIRMIYVKIALGMNSNSKDHAENKAYYDSRINLIANKEVAEEHGHFWGIEELKIHKEGSLVVAGGSNDATSIYSKHIEAGLSTSDTEPVVTTQKKESIYKFLSNNLKQ